MRRITRVAILLFLLSGLAMALSVYFVMDVFYKFGNPANPEELANAIVPAIYTKLAAYVLFVAAVITAIVAAVWRKR